MYADPQVYFEAGQWHASTPGRLAVSLLLAALICAGALSIIRLPALGEIRPLAELIVEIIRQPPAKPLEEGGPEPVDTAMPKPDLRPTLVPEVTEAPVSEPVETRRPVIDWMSMIGRASKEIVDSLPKVYTVNPSFEEKRREAAERYRPSGAVYPKPVWENAEKDQLGRTVLKQGNCHLVLDDPSVIRRYQFETFDQHMVTCTYQRKNREGLPPIRGTREDQASRKLT